MNDRRKILIQHPTKYYTPLTEDLTKFNKLQLLELAEQNALTLTTKQIIKYHSAFIKADYKQYSFRLFKLRPSQELQDHIYTIQEWIRSETKRTKSGDPYTIKVLKYKELTVNFIAYVIIQECHKIVDKIKSI